MRATRNGIAVSLMAAAFCTTSFASRTAADEEKAETKKAAPPAAKLDQAAMEKKFQQEMTGAVLTGQYTVAGQQAEKPARPEKYTITKVIKLNGDLWVLHARIQYGEHDLTVPVPLRIQWAGDTPVITLTDVEVPGLGTFTSRVLFYGDRYAGTWQHGDVGGHLFGTIAKPKEESKP